MNAPSKTRDAAFGFVTLALVPWASACREKAGLEHPVQDRTPVESQATSPTALSARSASAASAVPPARAALAPLDAPSWVMPLPVKGHGDAMVAVPLGSREPRGLVVALHGNFDRPEWACGAWRAVAPEPFVLCLRGTKRNDAPPGDDRFTYGGAAAVTLELDAALAALRERYGERLLPGPAVYAGFSLGAILGVSIAAKAPALYPRLVFVEGGHDGWTPSRAKAFHDGGGERVLFVCSQRGCIGAAKGAMATLKKAGVAVELVDAGDHGHSYDGAVADATRTRWPFVREGLHGFGPDAHGAAAP